MGGLRQAAVGLRRSANVHQALGRLDAALGHVHVRIGLVAVEQVSVSHHRDAEVAVEVERHRDGHVGPDDRADGGDEVALAVVHALGHHGAVQVEQHAVEPAGGLEIGQHPVLHVSVDVAGHPAGRRGRRRHRGHEGGAEPLGRLDHATQTGARPAEGLDDLAAVVEIARLELGAIGAHVTEGVGLVRHHGQEQSHARLLWSFIPASCAGTRLGLPVALHPHVAVAVPRPMSGDHDDQGRRAPPC